VEDAVRTGALSRRWRGLWTRANSLTSDSCWPLAEIQKGQRRRQKVPRLRPQRPHQRAKTDAALEQLAISFAIMSPADGKATKPLALRSTDAAQGWILYAMQKTAKSFVLKLQLFPIWKWYCHETNRCNIWVVQPMMDLINLPS
jgi:hypothetical protein